MRNGEAREPVEPGLAGGAALGLLAVALEKVTALGIALYLPRHLGLEDYGRYALLVSYLGLFQALPDASLEAVLVTQLARAEGSTVLAGKGTVVRIGVSIVGAAAALASLAAATGARFSLLPPDNSTGNYVKVVQRIPVRISLDSGQDPEHLLRPGMSVVPTIHTD